MPTAHVLVKIRYQFRSMITVRTLESRQLAALVVLMFPQTFPSQEHARTVRTGKRLKVLACPPGRPEN